MTPKEYLNQVRDAKYQIESDLKRLDELRDLATATGSRELKQDIVQTSIKNAGLEEPVGKIVDCEAKIREEIKAYLDLKNFIVDQIRNLEAGELTSKYVQLLMRRYIDGESYELISVAMGYSYEWIRHLHSDALVAFGNQYEI